MVNVFGAALDLTTRANKSVAALQVRGALQNGAELLDSPSDGTRKMMRARPTNTRNCGTQEQEGSRWPRRSPSNPDGRAYRSR